jgi:hypothetical protein
MASGFLSKLFGWGKSDRYVTESAFAKNLASQVAMAPQTLQQLREYDVTDQTRLRLEFFFYTNSLPNASRLADVLKKLAYSVNVGPSAGEKALLLITGWTDKMIMDEPTVVGWTRQMCQLGFDCDCEFDGWGTNPKQDDQ